MRFASLYLLAISTAGAQPWTAIRQQNPGLEFTLTMVREGVYHEGEPIRAHLRLPPGGFTPGTPPPAALWSFTGLLLDPPSPCGTLAAPCYPQSPRFGGIASGPYSASATPPPIAFNSFVNPLRPGHYRAVALARKLVLRAPPPAQIQFIYAEPAQYAVSNTVEFEIVAASPAWTSQAIAASVALLKGPEPTTSTGYQAREQAAEQLQFLDQPASWTAILESLPAAENILWPGLSNTRQPARVCALMQTAILSPSQSVSSYYLDTMGRLCATAQMPEPPKGEQPAYWKQWADRREAAMATAADALAASLPAKLAPAKAVAFTTLIERARQEPKPTWIPAVQAEFIKSFLTLNTWSQRSLLSQFAYALRSPEFIPLLESVLDRWKPGDYYEAPREALATLYALDPARARARIIAELKRDRTWLDSPQLVMLPPSATHLTDDELIAQLAAAQHPGGWNVPLSMTALARYASPKALPRIKAIYESQQQPCQPELVAYFVRVEPAYAARVFHSHPWDMQSEPPPCTIQYFTRTPPIAMGPELEAYMTAYLAHRTVRIKQQAAQSLSKFGSPAAAAALWDTFRYFHDYWKGKAEQLLQNGEGVGLERELRSAIARGRHWLTTDTDLRTLEALCITGMCLQETRQDLANWQRPLRLELYREPTFRGVIAQYYALESRQAFLDKLAQFPKGTQFRMMSDDADVRRFAAAHGLIILPR
ncbi:MAG: hypothetical protein ABI806_24130 [Candidatus Solibacter sp.]